MLTPAQARLDYDQHLATFSAALLGAALLRPQPQAPVPRQSGWKIVTERPSPHERTLAAQFQPAQWYTGQEAQRLLGCRTRQHTYHLLARLRYWGLLRRKGTHKTYQWARSTEKRHA